MNGGNIAVHSAKVIRFCRRNRLPSDIGQTLPSAFRCKILVQRRGSVGQVLDGYGINWAGSHGTEEDGGAGANHNYRVSL